jgi:hypothetical protein
MKNSIVIILLALFATGCTERSDPDTDTKAGKLKSCSTPARLKNLTGKLDGCGYVLELNDKTILEPVVLPDDIGFDFSDGKLVYINYEEVEAVSVCMAGKTVKVTCMKAADTISECIKDEIQKIKNEAERNPPGAIYRYTYQQKKVYFIPQYCCDFFSVLLDENCVRICHPDGGIAGNGDGKCSDFFNIATDEELVWRDDRAAE